MIDATTFHRSIQEISKLSERLCDEWVLHDDENIPENAFISKKFKTQTALGLLTFEYHIIFNINYSVPVLLFNAYKSDGAPVTSLEGCNQLLNTPKLKHVLMQQEHPRLHVPFLTFHPCKTSEIMEAFANKTKNPVVSWISAIGPHVHLNIPIAYSELTFKKSFKIGKIGLEVETALAKQNLFCTFAKYFMNWMTRENSFRVSLSGGNNMGDLTLSELKNTFGHHHEYKPEKKNTFIKCLKTNSLTLLTIAGVVGGVGLGFIMRSSKNESWPARQILYVNFAGDLFLRILKALILPLIFSSLISAIGSLDLKLSGRIGVRAVGYYLATTICAVILGIIVVVIVHPGKGHTDIVAKASLSRNVTTVDTLMDLFRNMFPPNLIQACTHQYRTVLVPPAAGHADIYDWEITHEYVPGMNILGLVVFSTAFGIAIGKLGPSVEPLLILFQSFSSLMMLITNWVIWLSPLGILFLVSSKILEMDNFESTIGQLGMYFMTVLFGLCVHAFVVLPIMYFIITKRSPIKFVLNMSQALATAFGTASSSATLPIAISCLEERNGIDPRVARFVMPIGATINMDGTALYEAVAAIFIAQTRGMSLSLGSLVAISITATAASIGAAGIPQAGLVTMVMVLDTVGLPAEDVTLIIAVDWLLDRFRTTINVMGDSLGAGIVNHLSKVELDKSVI